MTRGEIYRVRDPRGDPKRFRCYVVVSRQSLINARFSSVICAPVFSQGLALETQVSIGVDEGMKQESWIACDNLVSLSKTELRYFVGSLSRLKMRALDDALRVALGLD
jgi:mRNA interferase MazF